ncbi:hypothetical protein SLEP1_g53679 [Rubroshorea leprosula]|uniref:NAC domain-containing protein n=1 Tax=Rubroshorea leprosula TaxID=152421 RepID=A0AAV5MDM9_9ROSI|nr:hypothetical protein SLEP1_g53679 [Rubroshorea leprosula]
MEATTITSEAAAAAAAAAAAMNDNNKKEENIDEHEHDMVMPGFRFHPTEEELVEFYLRRKVEGKRFNVELITFLDLYRYDPWELPALAAIGEKEWFFYVPRDRKYRNGDRPNRVTTSGYWKATGADRMIRGENSRSIGLKKTLVFYSGKAPKGIRTSWIMNEYRLPHHETERYAQKTEISLCRVYKRAGVEDHPSLPRSLPTTSRPYKQSGQQISDQKKLYTGNQQQMSTTETEGSSSSTSDVPTALGLSKHNNVYTVPPPVPPALEDHQQGLVLMNNKATGTPSNLVPNNTTTLLTSVDDLHRLVSYQQQYYNYNNIDNIHQQQQQFISGFPSPSQQLSLNMLPTSLPTTLWDWTSSVQDNPNNNPFK